MTYCPQMPRMQHHHEETMIGDTNAAACAIVEDQDDL